LRKSTKLEKKIKKICQKNTKVLTGIQRKLYVFKKLKKYERFCESKIDEFIHQSEYFQ